MTQSSPDQSPTVTGRFSALPSLSTTHTKWPFAPCSTARCGTRIAFGRVAPFTRTRTYWFGRSTPCGLSTDGADEERAGLRVERRVLERDAAR